MDELNLKAANMTRLMSLLADVGWAEQLINGREVVYRISVEGAVQARKLPRGVLPSASVRLRDSKEHKGLERIQAAGRKYHRVLFFTNSTHTRAYHGAKPEVQPWEQDAVDVLGAIENHWSDEEEEGGLEIAVPPAAPVYAMAGARW
jgi:DNA polymerase III delta prime subunit